MQRRDYSCWWYKFCGVIRWGSVKSGKCLAVDFFAFQIVNTVAKRAVHAGCRPTNLERVVYFRTNWKRIWRIKFKIACITYKTISTRLLPSLPTSIHPWNIFITLHLVPCVRLTLNCCSFVRSPWPHMFRFSQLRGCHLPLQLFGTPFLWPFVIVSLLTVFGANSKLSSITLLSGLLNAPLHPAP